MCFAFSAVNGVFGVRGLLHLVGGFVERRPVITSDPVSSTLLILTPAGISIGLLFLFSKQSTPEEMKTASRRPMKWVGRYLIYLAASPLRQLPRPCNI
jgi:hypothetical protein